MRITLVLAIITVVTHCYTSNITTEAKWFYARQDDPKTLKLKEIAVITNDYGRSLEKSTFNIDSERRKRRTLYQSDMALTEKQIGRVFKDVERSGRAKRFVLKDNINLNRTWNDGVFYTFNTSDHHVQKVFKMGVKVWHDHTCINFTEDKNAKDKVVVVKGGGCWSSLGRVGGDQVLSLSGRATKGSAVHEIGHVLGLIHTMSRFDRDNYISIVWRNVDPRSIEEFQKIRENETEIYGLTYDYGSIMHYDELSGSINQQPTVIAKDSNYQKTMGSDLIAFSDIFVINEHYGCNAICNKSTSAKCKNEGFPHPRDCSRCICPSGYGGTLCDQKPLGCGEYLVATPQKKVVEYTLGFGFELRDHFDFCSYMISAPPRKKIEVEVLSISRGYDKPGCPKGGVEIKAQSDQKMTGYRFCSMKGTQKPIVSSSNRVPLILFNKLGAMKAKFTYRSVD